MKHLILFLLLFFSCISFSMAQEDSTKFIQHSQSKIVKTDSLGLHKSDLRMKDMSPDFKDLGNNVFMLPSDEPTFDLDKPKKTGIFNSSYSQFIIPTALITYGVLTRTNKTLVQLDHSTNNEVQEHMSKQIPYDDYMQFAPAVAVYGLDLVGIKAKHNFRDRTLIMATSYLIMGATVQTMKNTISIERPDGSNNHSFPSGHTATAFVGAHILFKEYKDASIWIGISGYAVATATGTMRVLNKKHWVSDVVTGAGVGILSAELGYMLLPVWHNILGIKEKDKSLVIMPIVNTENMGLALAYTF